MDVVVSPDILRLFQWFPIKLGWKYSKYDFTTWHGKYDFLWPYNLWYRHHRGM